MVRAVQVEPITRRKRGWETSDAQAWSVYSRERRRAAAGLLVQAARQLELVPRVADVRLARELLRKAARIHPRPAP